ncbi:MAG: cardiolipin synthase, partial [Acidobacteriota bacterium]
MPSDPHRRRLVELTERLVCLPILRGNEVILVENGHHFVDRLIEDIAAARDHVHMLFYIFADDAVGRRVAEALGEAVARGVRCRLLVDAFGGRGLYRSLGAKLREKGVELHMILPLNPFRRHFTRLDLRNHRKLVVIDGRLAYTGSQNIEDKPFDNGEARAWHDVMVRVLGPSVLQLQLVFMEDWYYTTGSALTGENIFPVPYTNGDIALQVMPSGPTDTDKPLRDLLIAAINWAHNSISITTPYFIPDEAFLVALHLAALRGVKVDLLIPRHADHPVVGSVARAYFNRLIDSGINIHFHEGLLHAKSLCIDDTVGVVGTANFDRRSFYLHSELSLMLYSPEALSGLKALHARYIAQSERIDAVRWNGRSRLKKTRDEVLKLLSPLL